MNHSQGFGLCCSQVAKELLNRIHRGTWEAGIQDFIKLVGNYRGRAALKGHQAQ
jgi:hypothetical protein